MSTVDKVKKNIANAFTILNMVCGGASIIASIAGYKRVAISLIIIAGILDRYDGALARKFNSQSDLGVQLDSMADALSFGIAPAVLVYMTKFYPSEKYWILLAIPTILYIVCGLFRLARYNAYGLDDDGNFMGIPITASGMFLVAMVMFSKQLGICFYLILMIILSYLMASKHKIKKM
ncbi:MAG: CDP-diacylglycerol--serine O-phosphatidyltransferase [Tissierellia bacterium]|nr:CDP-diacylglycerol--serine O-phosphatidyltransferase [Tissierellia bacterium]